MNTKCLLALGMIGMLLASACAQQDNLVEKAALVRKIQIPEREHGYSNFDSTVITSERDLDAFLKTASKGQGTGWNNRMDFEKALAQANVDFNKEVLVLLRHTEGSGSVQISFRPPRADKTRVICRIDREEPEIGTADMAYYCFAIAVSRSAFTEVELQIQDRKSVIVSVKF